MTLLSRTADNLYWLGRYMERVENTARSLDVAYRMSQLPSASLAPNAEWIGLLESLGLQNAFDDRFKKLTPAKVIAYLTVDDKNPFSIKNTFRAARENARAERNSIPTEVFESLNATWLELKQLTSQSLSEEGYRANFDWIKDRIHALRGLLIGVMLRTEAYDFYRIGTFIERGDNTARLVDAKFHFLSTQNPEDKIEDYYRWGALLRSLSAFKSYRTVYSDAVRPMKVVELLLLNPDLPRSIHHCTKQVQDTLLDLAPRAQCTRIAKHLHGQFDHETIEPLLKKDDLHKTLENFTSSTATLSSQIAEDFLLAA